MNMTIITESISPTISIPATWAFKSSVIRTDVTHSQATPISFVGIVWQKKKMLGICPYYRVTQLQPNSSPPRRRRQDQGKSLKIMSRNKNYEKMEFIYIDKLSKKS